MQYLSKKKESKRILLHSDVDILALVTTHSTEIQNLQKNMTKFQSEQTKASGSTYVSWGRKSCPHVNGTELVYSASNYVCLSPDPLWGHYDDGHNSRALVYGAEYEFNGFSQSNAAQFFGRNVYDEDAPCSVCRSSRPTMIMIPGRNECYPGWTMEYAGYLVAGAADHSAASEYICLDAQPEALQNGHADMNGKLFYFVEGRSGSLPCTPYVDGRELTCVVCTK